MNFSRVSFGWCGRFTSAEILASVLSFLIVCVWILTGHWLLMDGELTAAAAELQLF